MLQNLYIYIGAGESKFFPLLNEELHHTVASTAVAIQQANIQRPFLINDSVNTFPRKYARKNRLTVEVGRFLCGPCRYYEQENLKQPVHYS
jgi:hypothetical protein